jgi:hypothetical protein
VDVVGDGVGEGVGKHVGLPRTITGLLQLGVGGAGEVDVRGAEEVPDGVPLVRDGDGVGVVEGDGFGVVGGGAVSAPPAIICFVAMGRLGLPAR